MEEDLDTVLEEKENEDSEEESGEKKGSFRKSQKVLENSRKIQKILESTRKFQKILGNSREYQEIIVHLAKNAYQLQKRLRSKATARARPKTKFQLLRKEFCDSFQELMDNDFQNFPKEIHRIHFGSGAYRGPHQNHLFFAKW